MKYSPPKPKSPNIRNLDGDRWLAVEAEAETIFSMHELHFGAEHIETISSHVWLLTVQLIVQREKLWQETLQILLSQLRSRGSCGQRIIRSVLLRQEVASLLAQNGNDDKCTEVLRGMLEDIESSKDGLLKWPLDRLRRSIEEKQVLFQEQSRYKAQGKQSQPEVNFELGFSNFD
jgi:hypothetical protein